MTVRTFHRDRYTWLAYLLLGYFAYLQAALGPLMPFVRSELNLSYTVGGLHLSAFAAGMIGAGLLAASLARRFGRRVLLWGGAAGMSVGSLLLVSAAHVVATIGAAFVMGFLGTLMLTMIPATLSDHHQELRATALTESNVVAMLCAGLSPLLIGLFQRTLFGWRGALLAAIVALLLIAAFNWRTPIPPPRLSAAQQKRAGRLPYMFWLIWVVLILCVAMEWIMVGWSTDFLRGVISLEASDAAMLVSVFFVGAVLGRTANSRWTLRTPVRTLLLTMLGVVAVGFPIFWLVRIPALAVIGLGITGFGIGALFPLGLSMALTIAADNADTASGYMSLAAGLAILAAPFTLGVLADQFDLVTAFAAMVVLIVSALVLTLAVRYDAASKHPQ
ncbi:MAG: MFS transporter [Chloroflexota bacterium]|nr:MFS transporter [Caldilinea sp.]GIK73521.1 MAG: MFS transporter [Chloroflexota bacterium]